MNHKQGKNAKFSKDGLYKESYLCYIMKYFQPPFNKVLDLFCL